MAIFDSVWVSFAFRNKPIAAVGYSAGIGAGIRAIEHLAQIAFRVMPPLGVQAVPASLAARIEADAGGVFRFAVSEDSRHGGGLQAS